MEVYPIPALGFFGGERPRHRSDNPRRKADPL
jgi:hypothetical protein